MAVAGISSGAAIDRAVQRGVRFLLDAQRPDGSWEGFWGVNFTYAIMYAVDGLLAACVPARHPAIRRACDWLISKQRADGGFPHTPGTGTG